MEKLLVLSSREGCLPLSIVDGRGDAVAVVWPGMGGRYRSLHRIRLEPGAGTIRMKHPGEAVYYVARGSVTVADTATREEAKEGAMVFVEPHTDYAFTALDEGVELLGGPCPPDPSLYEGHD